MFQCWAICPWRLPSNQDRQVIFSSTSTFLRSSRLPSLLTPRIANGLPSRRFTVKRLEGKPFAILGVNSDGNRDDLKKVLVDEKITWRSWFDGSRQGQIAQHWNIHGWPTLFVLDHKGAI